MARADDTDIRKRIADLVSTVRRLEQKLEEHAAAAPAGTSAERQRSAELDTYREEIRAQNDQLLDLLEDVVQAREHYVDLYDSAPFAYFTLDGVGTIEEVNLTGADLLGRERSHLLGLPLLNRVAERSHQAFLEHMRRCRQRATGDSPASAVTTELDLRPDHGAETVPVELHSRPSWTFGEDSPRFRTVAVDLTERRRAEEERQRLIVREETAQAASDAKDRFLAVLSHELRTPLTPALLILERLEERDDLLEEVRIDLRRVIRNIRLESRLIDDLLDLSRIREGKVRLEMEAVDLRDVLETVVELCAPEARAKDHDIRVELEASDHRVRGDSTRIHQVFWNLLRNAVEYTPDGGRITVRSRDAEDGVALAVRDNGRGMDADTLAHLFDPFERGRSEGGDEEGAGHGAGRSRTDDELSHGLGIGLAITRSLVELHDGRIGARSEGPGEGSEFEVVLPAAGAESAAAAPRRTSETVRKRSPEPAPAGASRLRILLVEDHPDTAGALAELLKAQGYEVAVSDTVESATAHDPDTVDLLVSDIALPDGSGMEVLERLSAERDLTAIAVSGFGTESDVERARRAGFAAHLTKPLQLRELLATIERLHASDGDDDR